MDKKLIPSKYVRDYCEKNNWEFDDWAIAALIYNSPSIHWEERLKRLEKFAKKCKDEELIRQIQERIDYEHQIYDKLTSYNDKDNYIYGVYESGDDTTALAFFTDYKMAKAYNDAMHEKTEEQHYISLYKINRITDSSWTKEEIIQHEKDSYKCPWDEKDEEKDLDLIFLGNNFRIGTICFTRDNKIKELIVLHDFIEGNELESWGFDIKRNFDNKYIEGPNPFKMGDIVKCLTNNQYGIVDCDPFIATPEQLNWFDYSDYQVSVLFLRKDGTWDHEHFCPIMLEKDKPKAEKGNKQSENYVKAFKMFSAYLKDYKNKEKQKKALKASKEYAKSCVCDILVPPWATNNIEDIYF